MTTIDLRADINAKLNSMPLSMLEKVADFVKKLGTENVPDHSITPLVASMLTGHSADISDTELKAMKDDYLQEKYK